MSARRSVAMLALMAALAVPGLGAGAGSHARIVGFRAAGVDAQIERESRMRAMLSPDSLRKHLRILTAEPHVEGTPADRATAEYVRDRLAAYGWNTRIEAIPVYLNYPGAARSRSRGAPSGRATAARGDPARHRGVGEGGAVDCA